MSFIIAYKLAKKDLEKHRRTIPIDHPDMSINPRKLDFAVLPNTFEFISASGFVNAFCVPFPPRPDAIMNVTLLSYQNVSAIAVVKAYSAHSGLSFRNQGCAQWYEIVLCLSDNKSIKINKAVNGTLVNLHTSTDVIQHARNMLIGEVVGSSIRANVNTLSSTFKYVVTDTDLSEGGVGSLTSDTTHNDIVQISTLQIGLPMSSHYRHKMLLMAGFEHNKIDDYKYVTISKYDELISIMNKYRFSISAIDIATEDSPKVRSGVRRCSDCGIYSIYLENIFLADDVYEKLKDIYYNIVNLDKYKSIDDIKELYNKLKEFNDMLITEVELFHHINGDKISHKLSIVDYYYREYFELSTIKSYNRNVLENILREIESFNIKSEIKDQYRNKILNILKT